MGLQWKRASEEKNTECIFWRKERAQVKLNVVAKFCAQRDEIKQKPDLYYNKEYLRARSPLAKLPTPEKT